MLEEDILEVSLTNLITEVKSYLKDNNYDIDLIKRTFYYIKEKRETLSDLESEGLLSRSLTIAFILTSIKVDVVCLSAAMLHELIDYDNSLLEEVKTTFNEEIGSVLEGLIKIGRINFSTGRAVNNEYYKRILFSLSENVRVIVIILAERLYDMSHLDKWPYSKQKIRAKETLDIFAPIAHRLGIYYIKSELEDLALKYLKPDVYTYIEEKLVRTKNEREETVNRMLEELSVLLDSNNIKYTIKGRVKGLYSIYKKLDKGRPFSDIYDIYALRIILDDEQDCYLVLGLIHSKYKPLPKRFKDHIAMPKSNMYQSIHTTVFGPDGILYEIQIRTHDMDVVAEYGLAAHFLYKDKTKDKNNQRSDIEKKIDLFRFSIDDSTEKLSEEELLDSIKEDIYNTNIYVFTPKGDVIELRQDSTPIDFAYKVHTKIGEKMVGAVVNDTIVPLSHRLKDGDVVKITTNQNSNGPNKEWIKLAKSAQTKNKIKAFFTKLDRQSYIEKGKELLDKELKRRKLVFKEVFTESNIEELLTKLKITNIDELYHNIGYNNNIHLIMNLILKEEKEIELTSFKDKSNILKLQNTKDLLLVDGIDSIKINLAGCCTPIIGDDIIGYISKGSGITAHKTNCPLIKGVTERIIPVYWNENVTQKLPTTIMLKTLEKEKTLADIINIASTLDINIDSINTKYKKQYMVYNIVVLVANAEVLNKFLIEINKLPYIKEASRKI